MKPSLVILIADDSRDDRFLIQRALTQAGIEMQFQQVQDGQEALDYLKGKAGYADRQRYPLPMLLLLDLKLPLVSGPDLLRWIRSSETWKNLPGLS